ncbi:hypothetical protein C1S80_02955 [Mycolicibacterium aubagnense]|nr:hypothetical protein C1S80_02955 [Mycolicibacterium aubagnense]
MKFRASLLTGQFGNYSNLFRKFVLRKRSYTRPQLNSVNPTIQMGGYPHRSRRIRCCVQKWLEFVFTFVVHIALAGMSARFLTI